MKKKEDKKSLHSVFDNERLLSENGGATGLKKSSMISL